MADLDRMFSALQQADAAGNVDDAREIAAMIRQYQAQPQEDTSGFVPAVKSGAEQLQADVSRLAGRVGLRDIKEAERSAREHEAEARRVFTPTKDTFLQSPFQNIKELAGQSLPYMAAPVVAGALAPEGALALGAAGIASAAQFAGSNLSRQVQEGKKLEETNLLAAGAAAIPQAALDTFGLKMIPGVRGIFGRAGLDITEEQAKKLAERALLEKAGSVALQTGKTMGVEGSTEAAQQLLERLQAGLNIADPDARKEYFDSFVGGAILGGTLAVPGQGIEALRRTQRPPEVLALADEEKAAPEAPEAVQPSTSLDTAAMMKALETGTPIEIPAAPKAPEVVAPVEIQAAGAISPAPETIVPAAIQPSVVAEKPQVSPGAMVDLTTVPPLEVAPKALDQNNFVFLDKNKVKSGYGDVIEENGKKYISYTTPEGKSGKRLLTPNIMVNPNPDQIELLSLYKERDNLANQKDNLFSFLKKYKINPVEKADLGIDPADKRLPVGIFNKEKGLLLDDLALIAVENGIISEQDLQEGVGGVESLRRLIYDTLQGEDADTPQNLERRAKLNNLQEQIDNIESRVAESDEETQAQSLAKEAEQEAAPEAAATEGISPSLPEGPVLSTEEADNLAVAYAKATVEEKKAAQDVADHYKGDVVWQEGPIALVRDFGIQEKSTGKPLYRFVKNRSSYNYRLEDLTPAELGVTQEQKDKLIGIKDQLEKEAQEAHEKAPFLKMKQGVTGSSDLNKNILPIAKNWANILGIKSNIYITTDEDAVANQAKYTGPHRIIGYMGKRGVPGVMTKLDDNNYAIVLKKTTSPSKMLETLAHEMGHIHEKEVFDKATPETRKAIEAEFRKWYDTLTRNTLAKEMIETNLPKTMAQTTQMREGIRVGQVNDIAYWTKFAEWYANQVARWSVSSEKPVSVVEKFFAKLASAMRRFYQTVKGQKYLPSETMKQFLDNIATQVTFEEYAQAKSPKGQMALFAKDQLEAKTDTPAFKKWFGDSKVVDQDGKPLLMYHSTDAKEDFDAFDTNLESYGGTGSWFSSEPYNSFIGGQEGGRIIPAYLSLKNPAYETLPAGDKFNKNKLIEQGYDGIVFTSPIDSHIVSAVAFEPNQIKSAISNTGAYSPESANITEAKGQVEEAPEQKTAKNLFRKDVAIPFEAQPVTFWTEQIRRYQDKHVDLKRTVAAIKKNLKDLSEKWDPYQKEGLYNSKVANEIRVFEEKEVDPIAKKMDKLGVTNKEMHDYLLNRHAEEFNNQMNKINPDIKNDDGTITPYKLKDRASSISTKDAREYLANLDVKKQAAYESIAKDIDKIIKSTQKILVDSGQETQSVINAWNNTYNHYVPLFREMEDNRLSTLSKKGQGTGGSASKRAMGSEREVSDILNSVIGQREKAIENAAKIEVGKSLFGLALKAPNPDVWIPVMPKAIKNMDVLARELSDMGFDGNDVAGMMEERKTRRIVKDPVTGLDTVVYQTNPLERYKDNVFSVRINGEDAFIFFNRNNPAAANMVKALRNMDTPTIGLVGKQIGKATQWMAKVNTQWNPVFGAINFMRDFGSAMANLSTTEISDKKKAVAANIKPAMAAIWDTMRAERAGNPLPDTDMAKLYQEFRANGGQTLYREQLARRSDQESLINQKINALNSNAAKKMASGFFNGLSDFNDTIENAIRLSAYKAAREKGLSAEKSATIAKDLTVNFDRKGAYSQTINNYFAFFNAAAQGTARMTQTLKGPAGKKIIVGGLGLGALQAGMLAMAGFGDEDPPEFVKSRNFIIPTPDGKYLAIPYPLGLHFIPNIGRLVVETGIHGRPVKHAADMAAVIADAFNPLGGGNLSLQTISPTVLDPVVALATNQDPFGRPISKQDRATAPTPGFSRSREQATEINKTVAEALNYITGGTEDTKGFISPTADQLDFLVGQVTGGVGREAMKIGKTATAVATGETENLPSYQIPLAGRFYGDINSPAANSQHFYDNVTRMAEYEATIKGMRERKENVAEYLRDNPEARLWQQANNAENQISQLNKQKKKWREAGRPDEQIKTLDDRKQAIMTRFNERVKALEE